MAKKQKSPGVKALRKLVDDTRGAREKMIQRVERAQTRVTALGDRLAAAERQLADALEARAARLSAKTHAAPAAGATPRVAKKVPARKRATSTRKTSTRTGAKRATAAKPATAKRTTTKRTTTAKRTTAKRTPAAKRATTAKPTAATRSTARRTTAKRTTTRRTAARRTPPTA